MKASKRDGCCVKPIPGATNQPKMQSGGSKPIANAVALQPKSAGLAKIKGAVTGPK